MQIIHPYEAVNNVLNFFGTRLHTLAANQEYSTF